jgi:hypothetical protein
LRFTLQRDPDRLLSACADGPSGRDVQCRVHVRIRLMSASYAPEGRLALAVVRCAVPAGTAGLRRVRRVDFLDPSGRLVLQTAHQGTPAVAQNTPAQPCLGAATVWQVAAWTRGVGPGLGTSRHLSNPKIFYLDHVEPPRQIGTGLLHPILATFASARMQFGDRSFDSLTTMGASTAAGQAPLQMFEPTELALREIRAGQKFTGTQRGRHGDPAVNTDDLTRTWRGDRRWNNGECDVPATCPVAGYPVRPRIRYSTRQPQPHPTDFRHVDLGPLPVQPDDPGCLGADNAEALTQSRSAPGRRLMTPTVEALHGLVEVSQCLLLHRLRACPQPAELGPCLGQLATLLSEVRRRCPVTGPHRPLLKCQVPHVPRKPALFQQGSLLRDSRVQTEPGHETYPTRHDRQRPVSATIVAKASTSEGNHL